jgi:hypothetical protein
VDEEEEVTLFDIFTSAVFSDTLASCEETIRDIFSMAEEIEAADGDDVAEEVQVSMM